jgi:hypothetical protein
MPQAHEIIYRILDQELAGYGFARGERGWFRTRGPLLQQIHLHKFTFTTAFRVHSAIHPAVGDHESSGLNGPCSHDGWAVRTLFGIDLLPIRRYSFDYQENDESMRRCAMEITAYVRDVILPWFARWEDLRALLASTKSPLNDEEKAALKECLTSAEKG